MEYSHNQYPYAPQAPQPQMCYHPGPYPPYLQQQPQQLDDFYMTYSHPEYTNFMQHGHFHDEYEDAGEVSTRPRLTREQVGVLEAQFQANHKPNSMVKRQLAMQTNLSLARVANWFQNRRAKAKQQKKQEEFENTHLPGGGTRQEPEPGEHTNEAKDDDDQSDDDEDFPPKQTVISEPDDTPRDSSHDVSREASWASLQRALNAAKVAQSTQQASSHAHMTISMPAHKPQDETNVSSSYPDLSRGGITKTSHSQAFPRNRSWADAWASHHVFQDQSFDFGFDSQAALANCSQPGADSVSTQNHLELQENCVVSSDSWQDGLPTPRGGPHHPPDIGQDFRSPDLPLPAYPASRRGSAADSLTNNFDAFALTSDSPHALTTPVPAVPFSQPEAHLDLAARRKGRRPAPLTSTALRSRSYGAMTSMSPTFRTGMGPSAHTIRHVKSTGHNLNARYSGIRKPSSAQRSPNISTFGEAEAFNRLMAQQAAIAQATMTPTTETAGPLLSPPLMVNAQNPLDHVGNSMAHSFELARTYQLPTTQHLTLTTTSPPTTPFAAEFDMSHAAFGMPPVSAPLQYASFSDCTPPYSAGPLTNSSWSDAPLTSPDFPNFPPVTYIPSLGHMQNQSSMSGRFQDFVLASDAKPEMDSISNASDQKKADFFIQEFPNQKEEHASISRQLAQSKPKNYVFANTAPSDYDQS